MDDKEDKLQLIEAEQVRRRKVDTNDDSGGGCSSSSLASASSSDGDGGSSDEEASTSDDAIYAEKFEPESDLMKSMMRENLRRKSKKLGEEKAVNKKVVEMEVVDNKGVKEVTLMNEESKLGNKLNKNDRNQNTGNDGSVINGPMFKDFGGIGRVIEELEMEVTAASAPPRS